MPRAAAIVCAIIFASAPARACPDAQPLRDRLDRELHRARVWNVGWGAAFGVAAIGYGAMAESRWEFGLSLDDAKVDGLWVGAVQATISALGHVIVPLRTEAAPAPTGDPCKDYEAAAHAVAVTAAHERTSVWLSLAGGVVLEAGGFFYLGLHDHAWGQGGISLASGIPVAIAHAWTIPRIDDSDVTITVGAARTPQFTGVVIGGSF